MHCGIPTTPGEMGGASTHPGNSEHTRAFFLNLNIECHLKNLILSKSKQQQSMKINVLLPGSQKAMFWSKMRTES